MQSDISDSQGRDVDAPAVTPSLQVRECGNPKNAKIMITRYFRKTETKNDFEIDPKYADDITWATTAKQRITYIKETIPSTLAKRNLVINESTEEYEIIRQGNEKWKKWGVC